ncbi:hypothetical protein PR048_013454 [Dryococelus australis]|uniref:Uncharacterized protein n=1 Tax=Dryococelus australis TaxID=614101 RepID=A0ABQ9HS78_9NEOP|nr:hypothetical protein PR048_013454 [Dryococelus australis]
MQVFHCERAVGMNAVKLYKKLSMKSSIMCIGIPAAVLVTRPVGEERCWQAAREMLESGRIFRDIKCGSNEATLLPNQRTIVCDALAGKRALQASTALYIYHWEEKMVWAERKIMTERAEMGRKKRGGLKQPIWLLYNEGGVESSVLRIPAGMRNEQLVRVVVLTQKGGIKHYQSKKKLRYLKKLDAGLTAKHSSEVYGKQFMPSVNTNEAFANFSSEYESKDSMSMQKKH